MSKDSIYLELQKRYENLQAVSSVKHFFNDNKSYCTRHGITLKALQNRAAKEKWQLIQDQIGNLEEKIEAKTNEIVDSKTADLDQMAEQKIRIQRKILDKLEYYIDNTDKPDTVLNAISKAIDATGMKSQKLEQSGSLDINPFKIEIIE